MAQRPPPLLTSEQLKLIQAHVSPFNIRQIATSHVLLKVNQRHLDYLDELMIVKRWFLDFHTIAGHKMMLAHRRVSTLPT